MKTILQAIIIILIFGCNNKPNDNGIIDSNENLELKVILEEWANNYLNKIDKDYKAIINFSLTDSDENWYLDINDLKFTLKKGKIDTANFSFKSTLSHYNKMYNGKITGLTSMGQATSKDKIPLIPQIHKPVENSENALNDFLFFSQRFFNSSPYDKIVLKEENSRIVHGGHAIALFYQKTNDIGVRSAWYQINKGEQVNEIGDVNSFPQYFIVTKGSGFAKIGNDTIKIKLNEAYFVAPENDHVFWNESDEPLNMIFIAWGKGA
jgi:mannose-6-phosphate isomerase-like protein (cupin superfamily)